MDKSGIELLKDAQRFRIDGGINGEIATRFRGVLHILPDGKVLGVVRDCRSECIRKIVLGIEHSGYISFWKIAHVRETLLPEIYNCEGFKTGGYVGRYDQFDDLEQYVEMLKDIPEIDEALESEDDEKVLEILANVDPNRIEEYLNAIVIANVNVFGKVSSFKLIEETN